MGRGNQDRKHGPRGGGDGRGGGGDGPGQIKRIKMQDKQLNPEVFMHGSYDVKQRIIDRIRNLNPADLEPKKFEVKKFMANTRLYVGNLANDVTEDELKDLFAPYGELDELFVNREKNFAFLKLDFRTNAEKARSELDQKQIKNRPIKVRFAPASVRVKVKNLSPMISNELLELGFSIFGEIERALVYVDDKGKSIGEGIVDFTRKNNALLAHKFCSERCYFLSSELRPVETELGEMYEVDEGLLESNLSSLKGGGYGRRAQDNTSYYAAREVGPRVAEEGSFEHEYGMKWKALTHEYKVKEMEMKQELQIELENLHKKMELAKYDYETEMLRRQLKQREMDQERHRMEWEQRIQNNNRGFGGGFGNQGGRQGGGGGGFGNNNRGMDGPRMIERHSIDHMGGGRRGGGDLGNDMGPDGGPGPLMDNLPGDGNMINMPMDESESASIKNELAPPPLPPQGLMDNLDNLELAPGGDEGQNVTWEIGPFSQQPNSDRFGGGSGGQQQVFRDRPGFQSGGKGDRDRDRSRNSGGGGGRGGNYRGGRGGGGGGNYRGNSNGRILRR